MNATSLKQKLRRFQKVAPTDKITGFHPFFIYEFCIIDQFMGNFVAYVTTYGPLSVYFFAIMALLSRRI
jgi:hypothetical protein